MIWRLGSLLVLAGFVGLWAEVAAAKVISPVFLPTPLATWFALVNGFRRGTLGLKFLGTIEHMVGGWLIASIAGIALGAFIGSSKAARTYIGPTLEFLRPLPASAIIPIAITVLGLTPAMALSVIGFGAIWPMLLATMHGFASVEPRLSDVARVLGLRRTAIVLKISLPSAAPDILAGLRLGLTVSLILAVVCEMIGGLDGLGQWELLAARSYKSADLFVGVILLGVIGIIANALLTVAESFLLRWQEIADRR